MSVECRFCKRQLKRADAIRRKLPDLSYIWQCRDTDGCLNRRATFTLTKAAQKRLEGGR